jgi:hypothetical protein
MVVLYNITVALRGGEWLKYRKLSEQDLVRVRRHLDSKYPHWLYFNIYKRLPSKTTEFVRREKK